MSNTVSITGVGAADECVVIALAQEGQEEKRTLWLGRYIAALRGMVLIFSTPEEANLAQEALHGKVLTVAALWPQVSEENLLHLRKSLPGN